MPNTPPPSLIGTPAEPFARALHAVLWHPATFREWAQGHKPHPNDQWKVLELPVTNLMISLLRNSNAFATAFFPGVPPGQWWEGGGRSVDIAGGPHRYQTPTHLVEIKFTARVSWGKGTANQFDKAIAAADNPTSFVVVPHKRSTADYQAYLRSKDVESWAQWNVVSWSDIRDWLGRALKTGQPNYAKPNALTQVALSMARVWV